MTRRTAGLSRTAKLAAVPVAAALMPATASADIGGTPIRIEPIKEKDKKGDITTQATPGVAYRCSNSGTLRRRQNSFVIGWCMQGNRIDISSGIYNGWQGGYAYGNYNNCGWFQLIHGLYQDGTFNNNCGSTTFAESYFANAINNDRPDDGSPVGIKKNCDVWGNVGPWGVSTVGYDRLHTLNTGAGDKFFWRYRSKNDFWVLGRYERPGQFSNWGFVQRDCVDTPAADLLRAPSSVNPGP